MDPDEVAHYEELAHRWWDTDGPLWPLHKLNTFRVGYIREHLSHTFVANPAAEHPLKGQRLVDIGAGGGILSESNVGLGADVPAIAITLDESYPDDQARGYKLGDVRGAFILSKRSKRQEVIWEAGNRRPGSGVSIGGLRMRMLVAGRKALRTTDGSRSQASCAIRQRFHASSRSRYWPMSCPTPPLLARPRRWAWSPGWGDFITMPTSLGSP